MNKKKKSMYNAIVNIANVTIVSILSLVSVNLIINNYGSDYNGVIATANQLINMILIVEGGFSVAINVALYKYLVSNDYANINKILSYTNKKFKQIGLFLLGIGTIATIIYPFFIKSPLPYFTISMIIFMVVLSTFASLFYAVKWRIMFQTAQKEYIINGWGIILNIFFSVLLIVLAYFKFDMFFLRLSVLLNAIFNCVLVYYLFKKQFPKADYNEEVDNVNIKGVSDVFFQKMTMVIYGTAPILFIATFINTSFASIFAVYNYIYLVGKNILASVCAAPVNAFGQLISEKGKPYVYEKYKIFEFIIMLFAAILLTSILIMIVPFVKLYTQNVHDVNYINYGIAILLAITIFLEVIYYPCEMLLNVSSNFKMARNIRIISCATLVIAMLIGVMVLSIYGVLIAMIISNLILLIYGTKYIHENYFNSSSSSSIRILALNIIIATGINYTSYLLLPEVKSYISFMVIGIAVFFVTSIVFIIINTVFYKKYISFIYELTIDKAIKKIENRRGKANEK
jgi:O-antigen/teichoic acid export membrane protein